MNHRDFFKIESHIPGLINEEYVFEQEQNELSECMNRIDEFRESIYYNAYILRINHYYHSGFFVRHAQDTFDNLNRSTNSVRRTSYIHLIILVGA